MNKNAMQSARTEQPADAGISLNTALKVQAGRREWLGFCNACSKGVYDTEDGVEFTTEVSMRSLTFRLCQRCRVQLKGML
jgi:hypothetical protein